MFREGDAATSIPSQCCVYPFILNGGLYYNCTVKPNVSSDLGCYHTNGEWVTCQQPDGRLHTVTVITGRVGERRNAIDSVRLFPLN